MKAWKYEVTVITMPAVEVWQCGVCSYRIESRSLRCPVRSAVHVVRSAAVMGN
jgi:hypothetical protein